MDSKISLPPSNLASITSPDQSIMNNPSHKIPAYPYSATAAPAPASNTISESKKKNEMLKLFVHKALENVKNGGLEDYYQIIKVFTDMDLFRFDKDFQTHLYKTRLWIYSLIPNVSSIDHEHYELVNTILYTRFYSIQDDQFVSLYFSLVLQIASAKPTYSSLIIKNSISWFLFKSLNKNEAPDYLVFNRVHTLLAELIKIIPTLSNEIYFAISKSFPHKRDSVDRQTIYLKNALKVLKYCPELQKKILLLAIDRILQIDVEIQVEVDDLDLEDFTQSPSKVDSDVSDGELVITTSKSKSKLNEVSNMDSDSDSDSDSASEDDYVEDEVFSYKAPEMVTKLDSMLFTLLTYMSESHNAGPRQSFDNFALSLELFDQIILPTFKSRYTQFFMFYICSLNTSYSDLFLGHLVSKIGQPVEFGRAISSSSRSAVLRMSAASYLSSFVARALFLTPQIIRNVVGVLSQWANTYLDLQDDGSFSSTSPFGLKKHSSSIGFAIKHTDPSKFEHPVFYSVCQAIFYIFCYRWRDLLESPSDSLDTNPNPYNNHVTNNTSLISTFDTSSFSWCPQSSGIHRLVFSKLNPLKFCSSIVSKQFALVASQLSFIFCLSLIDQNRRNNRRFLSSTSSAASLPSLRSASSQSTLTSVSQDTLEEMSSFFPFDPFSLNQSKSFIDPIYFVWCPVFDSNSSSDDSDDSDCSNDDDDDDDVNMDGINNNIHTNSISRAIEDDDSDDDL
ncbi:RNA polymerase I-specific transcription initiation factor rrn3 [Smittium culicis]|uniref:RNA polymerase I-specific transcription initiation factor rrn3 n=1 Tax=Smittium culicis TaxID=133412 RepID=A0A1R1YJ12_9FUNG|nr:RNA polymerase I-specific transcription initiation factor rrn3 [Smittium culicis]